MINPIIIIIIILVVVAFDNPLICINLSAKEFVSFCFVLLLMQRLLDLCVTDDGHTLAWPRRRPTRTPPIEEVREQCPEISLSPVL